MRMGEGAKGGRMTPRETLGRSLAPLAQPPPSLGGGVDASPLPLYKGGPRGGGAHTQQS